MATGLGCRALKGLLCGAWGEWYGAVMVELAAASLILINMQASFKRRFT